MPATRVTTTEEPYEGIYPDPDPLHLCESVTDVRVCFDGILRRIWMNSGQKYNIAEMTLTYQTSINNDNSNPAFVFNYETPLRYSTGPSMRGQFFGVRFQRIRVLPLAYALRSDFASKRTNNLRSWVFQARGQNNTSDDSWVTLDEQARVSNLSQPKAHILAFVETDSFFREFRVLQTGPSHSNFLSFNLSGFEIHGYVQQI
jgi:hypothetical protein